MNKINPEVTITRRQLLLTIAAGAASLATSAIFAKLPSQQNQAKEPSNILPNAAEHSFSKPFVLSF